LGVAPINNKPISETKKKVLKVKTKHAKTLRNV
jgi:hypothetical protein